MNAQSLPSLSLWKNSALWLVLALSILPMVPYNWLPVLFNIFERDFGANLEQQGRTVQYLFTSGLLIVLIGGWLTEKLRLKAASCCAVLACGMGLLFVGVSTSFGLVLLGCSLYGFGTTWMYLIYGVFVSRFFSGQHQKAFLVNNMVLSLVGGSGPAILGLWLSKGFPWRHAFLWIGGLNLVFSLLLLRLWRRRESASTQQATRQPKKETVEKIPVLSSWNMWLIGIAYILHGVAEIGIISWAGKLYHQRLGIAESHMALFISANVISFALGRFLLTFIAGRFRDLTLLALCAAGGTLFFALILLTTNYTLGLIFMAGSGIFMSGNAPAMNSFLAQRFAKRLEFAFAIYQGFGALGSAVAPPLIGFVGDRTGLETAAWLIPLASGALAVLALSWDRFQVRSQRSNSAQRLTASNSSV
jgi:predicted MFS family arabinose efflux permease